MIDPGLVWLAAMGGPPVTDNARRMMLAIALQESGLQLAARYQNHPSTSAGPARGWWQFEQSGGVHGVINHAASKTWAQNATARARVAHHNAAVWRALEGHDLLTTAFARLLLWTHRDPLPTTQQSGWDYYMNLWRPGKPKPDAWPSNWRTADQTINTNRWPTA